MQYNLITGVVPVLTLDADGNPNYHDLIIDLMINKQRNISIAQVIGTHRKTLVLTAQPSLHCGHIEKHIASVETRLKYDTSEKVIPTMRTITREDCDNIIQHQDPDLKTVTLFDHVPDAADFIDQQALVMSFNTFEKLLCWHSHMEIENSHVSDKNPAEAAIHAIFNAVDVVLIATPHKDIDKMIEYAQFGFESAPKKKGQADPKKGVSMTHGAPHATHTAAHATHTHASGLPRLPVTPVRTGNTGLTPASGEIHLPTIEKTPIKKDKERPRSGCATPTKTERPRSGCTTPTKTERPRSGCTTPTKTERPRSGCVTPTKTERPHSGCATLAKEKPVSGVRSRPQSPVPKHDQNDFVHKSDNNQHYIARPISALKKTYITLCEFGDNIDPYVQWCKWHSEKIARISTYDIATYRKEVHYQHKQSL